MKAVKRIIALAAAALLLAFAFNIGSVRDFVLEAGSSVLRSIGIFTAGDRPSQEEVMAEITEQIKAYRTTVKLENADSDTAVSAFKAVFKAHPEFFWIDGGYTCTQRTAADGSCKTELALSLNFDADSIPEMDSRFREAVSAVTSQISAGSSDYEKALFVHDYIISNCDYDFELSGSISSGAEEFDRSGITAYGCLIDHLAVCSGYTAAFQVLMNELGVEGGRTEGVAGSKGVLNNHVWNYITLDGDSYYIDVTWDDLGFDGTPAPAGNQLSHRYFCVTGSELYKSHSLDEGETDANCVATKYNYHIYNKYYLSSYGFDAVSKIIDSQFGSGVMEVKFSSFEELQRACSDLFESNSVFSIPSIRTGGYRSVWHSECEDSCVLTLWIE